MGKIMCKRYERPTQLIVYLIKSDNCNVGWIFGRNSLVKTYSSHAQYPEKIDDNGYFRDRETTLRKFSDFEKNFYWFCKGSKKMSSAEILGPSRDQNKFFVIDYLK